MARRRRAPPASKPARNGRSASPGAASASAIERIDGISVGPVAPTPARRVRRVAPDSQSSPSASSAGPAAHPWPVSSVRIERQLLAHGVAPFVSGRTPRHGRRSRGTRRPRSVRAARRRRAHAQSSALRQPHSTPTVRPAPGCISFGDDTRPDASLTKWCTSAIESRTISVERHQHLSSAAPARRPGAGKSAAAPRRRHRSSPVQDDEHFRGGLRTHPIGCFRVRLELHRAPTAAA